MESNRETAHRWRRPVMNSAERCECELCLRHDEMMADYEALVARPIVLLLREGWMPTELVKLVKSGAPKSSRASMVVRVALVRWATERCGDPSVDVHISEVRRLAARTGFTVGLTEPGWFEQWFWNKGRGDVRLARRTVRHVREVLDPVVELLLGTAAVNAVVWNTRSARSHAALERRVPDPSDPRWRW